MFPPLNKQDPLESNVGPIHLFDINKVCKSTFTKSIICKKKIYIYIKVKSSFSYNIHDLKYCGEVLRTCTVNISSVGDCVCSIPILVHSALICSVCPIDIVIHNYQDIASQIGSGVLTAPIFRISSTTLAKCLSTLQDI